MATATLDVLNPATGESIANVPNMSAEEVDEAVERAKATLCRSGSTRHRASAPSCC